MTATGGVEAVLFDLDDTLCEYRRSPGELLDAAFDAVGRDPLFDVGAYYARFDEFAERTGGIDELRRECFAALARENGHDPSIGREVARAFAAERDHGNVRCRPGAREVLDAFAGEYRLGLVTNGDPEMQGTKLDALGVRDRFDAVVFAGHDADLPAKPDPAPFEHALAALEATPERTVSIGDSIETDVAGASRLGIRTVWVPTDRPADEPAVEPDHAADSLSDLLAPPWRRHG